MNKRFLTTACAAICFIFLAFSVSFADDSQPSVTTTWLADPFPNTAPFPQRRAAVVEMDKTSRTPSVLLGVYDIECDPVVVESLTQPAHGRATINDDGTFNYSPESGYVGDDAIGYTLSDGRGGRASATLDISVIRPTASDATTRFVDLAEIEADGRPIQLANQAIVPRVFDWNADGKLDLVLGSGGAIRWYRNIGTPTEPRFAAEKLLEAAGQAIHLGTGRVAISIVDFDRDGKTDLLATPDDDRKVRFYRNVSTDDGSITLTAAEIVKGKDGEDFIAADIRADIADWNGDGVPDIVTGAWSGSVRIALGIATDSTPVFGEPTTTLDAAGTTIDGSYNLNVRLADIDQDGRLDLVDSYNWGTINFRIRRGSANDSRLDRPGRFNVTGPDDAAVNFHQLYDGPIVDFADLNGDGTTDMVVGGERGGTVRLATGQSGRHYLDAIREIVAAHPQDLGPYLSDPANETAKNRMRALQGALYDYVMMFATPSEKDVIATRLLRLITDYPQYFKLQTHDIEQQPGIPSLAVQTWLTTMMVKYFDPENRRKLCDAAGFDGGYRKLIEEQGLIYADNGHNPRGAEAIYQWVRTIPRSVYPGTCITAADWLGGKAFLVRGHMKNTFNGYPVDGGEYGFGRDAREVIGDRGSENWFMTVVHHEACHDLDAYVHRRPELKRRWGQSLVLAGGPDMRADPETGWLDWNRTREHFKSTGLWDGNREAWNDAWKQYWTVPPGSLWRDYGFMRGNISWFYGAPQESLATQGNQYWNSTEGRIEVAIDRWRRGYKSNLTEVLFYMEIWSLGANKLKFYENDNACNQVISFARLGRNRQGYIDRIDLGDRYYQFEVDENGVVTEIVHVPEN